MLLEEAETAEGDTAFLVDESDIMADAAHAVTHKTWPRPPVPPINPETNKIIFQQIDVDYYKVGLTIDISINVNPIQYLTKLSSCFRVINWRVCPVRTTAPCQ